MTAQQIVVHIGDFKTGSTSIQYALAKGLITAQGATWSYNSKRSHNYLAIPLLRPSRRSVEDVFGQMRRDMESSTGDIEIVSGEMFSLMKPETLEAAFRTYLPEYADSLRIVAYARPHASAFLARYTTQAKLGRCLTPLKKFYRALRKRGHLHYYQRFGAWETSFGSRFTLRPMVREHLVNGDVVADFMAQALGTEAVEVAPFDIQNTSPDLNHLVAMQVVHRALSENPDYSATRLSFGRRLSKALEAHEDGTGVKPWIDKAFAKNVARHFAKDAEAADSRFFKGTPLGDAMVDALKKAKGKKLSTEPADHLSPYQVQALTHWADSHRAEFTGDTKTRKVRELATSAEALIRALL